MGAGGLEQCRLFDNHTRRVVVQSEFAVDRQAVCRQRVGYQLIREEFSDPDREVFEALVFDGRKSAEIAKERGISVGAVHKVKSRIVGRLRRFLADLE